MIKEVISPKRNFICYPAIDIGQTFPFGDAWNIQTVQQKTLRFQESK